MGHRQMVKKIQQQKIDQINDGKMENLAGFLPKERRRVLRVEV